jgi:hypothetical protein
VSAVCISDCEAAELVVLANKIKHKGDEKFHTSVLYFEDFCSSKQFTEVTNFSYNAFLLYLGNWNNILLSKDL